jgi:hypothetical protein
MMPTDQSQNLQPADKDAEAITPEIRQQVAQRRWIYRFLGLHKVSEPSELSKEELKWELEQHLSLFKDYSDLAVKAVGIFAAVVGGILSISFTLGSNPDVKRLLLQAAYVMSLIMGGISIVCGFLWFRVSNEARWIGKQLKMVKFPDIIYLSYLLWVFAVLFFVAAAGVDWLKGKAL